MNLTAKQIKDWQKAKAAQLLPIVYLRGFAMGDSEIDDTTADPFNGFNIGSILLRRGWTGDSARHVFESPVLRLMQPPFNYRLTFSDGIRGLSAESKAELKDWRDHSDREGDDLGSPRNAVIAIYRYYDIDSHLVGEGKRAGMATYGWGLGRLIVDLLEATQADGVYIVAHSMGGLVARTFLQNEEVLDERALGEESPVLSLITTNRAEEISQDKWRNARSRVRRFFTYGTPHNGITGHGGFGNALVGAIGSIIGFEIDNFGQNKICEYLGSKPANSLGGKFSVDNMFCLIGTGSADYPVAGGFARRLVGQTSDGLVEVDNASVFGTKPGGEPGETVLAARAFVRRAHSGPYGMVNSEEGFGNLARFLFGDARIDCTLIPQRIDLPASVKARQDGGGTIRASYSFESFLRVRGETWAMTERLVRDGTAAFRRYDELFPETPEPKGLTRKEQDAKKWHKTVDLFTAFLDTKLRTTDAANEFVGGRELPEPMGFALRLRVAVPDYEVDGVLSLENHYEGSALLDRDFLFLAFRDGANGWGLAWGPNPPGKDNAGLAVVADLRPGTNPTDDFRPCRCAADGAIEFWLPLANDDGPAFEAWMKLTARWR